MGSLPLSRVRDSGARLPRAFWYLWAGNFINRCGGLVAVLLAFYLRDVRGLSAASVGIVIGVIAGGGVAGVVIGGELADLWGRRRTMFCLQLATAAMVFAIGLARSEAMIISLGIVLGLVQSASRPVFATVTIDIVVDSQDRARAFNLNYWANNLAFSFAALLAGFLVRFNYTIIFALDSATTVAAAFLIFRQVPESRLSVPPAPRRGHTKGGAIAASPLTDHVYLMLCILTLLTSLIFAQYLSSLPLSMLSDGLSARSYSMVITLNGIMIVIGQLSVSKLVRGRDRSRVMALAAVIVGTGFGLTALAHNIWMYGLTIVVWTVGEMLGSSSSAALTADLSPPEARGRYQGVYSLAIAGGGVLGPMLGGAALGAFGHGPLWVACGVLGWAVAALHIRTGPARRRRAAELAGTVPGDPGERG